MADSPPQMGRMPWYPRDFASSTRDWPLIARAVYRELLDLQWDLNGLPADPAGLRALVGASPAEWKRAWPYVQKKFQRGKDGRLRNPRLEQHRTKAIELYSRRKAGADKTNAGRRGQVVHFTPGGAA